jgi:hypothetical protein
MFNYLKYLAILFIFPLSFAYSEILEPKKNISPKEVVKIQLAGLKKNDLKLNDNGILQTWNFAHPNNKIFTGPFERFKEMIKGDSYKMLLNHNSHEISEVFKDEKTAVFEVVILDKNKNYYRFRWQVEKYLQNGVLKNCWLTTMVSQPVPISEAA